MNLIKTFLNAVSGKDVLYVDRLDLLAALVNIAGSTLADELECDLDTIILTVATDHIVDTVEGDRLIRVELVSLPNETLTSLLSIINKSNANEAAMKRLIPLLAKNAEGLEPSILTGSTHSDSKAVSLIQALSERGVNGGTLVSRALSESYFQPNRDTYDEFWGIKWKSKIAIVI